MVWYHWAGVVYVSVVVLDLAGCLAVGLALRYGRRRFGWSLPLQPWWRVVGTAVLWPLRLLWTVVSAPFKIRPAYDSMRELVGAAGELKAGVDLLQERESDEALRKTCWELEARNNPDMLVRLADGRLMTPSEWLYMLQGRMGALVADIAEAERLVGIIMSGRKYPGAGVDSPVPPK